jgi:ribosomal protein S18 acetylase RimI-like enzyme
MNSASASIRIRDGGEADAGELAQFAARTFAEAFGADNRPEDLQSHLAAAFGLAQQSAELRNPDVATLLAHDRGALIAFAQVRRNTPPTCVPHPDAIELQRFYVDRAAHGQGIAQQLMQAVHDAAHRFGGRHLWLGVWERNPRAIAFYRKCGFADYGSHDFFVGSDRQTDRVLAMPIRPSTTLKDC